MSADAWSQCPRCLDAKGKELDALEMEVYQQYGKVSAEEFHKLEKKLSKWETEEDPLEEGNFREDYEIYGAGKGVIKVYYSGECQDCGLSVDFEFEKPFYPEEGT